MGLSVILGDLHKTPVQTPSIANRKTAPPPQVMLIIVETNWTLVHKIQVCISPYDGAIIHLQSVCGGQIILYFKYYRSSQADYDNLPQRQDETIYNYSGLLVYAIHTLIATSSWLYTRMRSPDDFWYFRVRQSQVP